MVTVSGPDRPGITARLTGILAEANAQLLDIEQVVVQGHLSLAMLIGIGEGRGALKELLFAAKELGVGLDFEPIDALKSVSPPASARYVVTAIGRCLGAVEMHALSATLAEHGGNIARIAWLSPGDLRSVEVEIAMNTVSYTHLTLPTILRV